VRLDRAWIAGHIPHQQRMCLLDQVLSWDSACIECASSTHRAPDHPLRAHGRLGAACLIEYAAQAMAIHGALLLSRPENSPAFGMLASARSVELFVERLDEVAGELLIRAERQHSDARAALYGFRVTDGQRLLARGRASLLLDANALAASDPPP
jgi:predicted hotdog family 3-hydroxylacyl-ACP dehydratase